MPRVTHKRFLRERAALLTRRQHALAEASHVRLTAFPSLDSRPAFQENQVDMVCV